MAWMTIVGLDWQGGQLEHPFDIVHVPQKPGLFKLHALQENGAWEVFFVGQASNLYATLLAYLGTVAEGDAEAAGISMKAKERITTSAVSYSYALLSDPRERSGCVRSLYDYFSPSCNAPDQIPDVTDVGCNPF